jgi:phosphoketolase
MYLEPHFGQFVVTSFTVHSTQSWMIRPFPAIDALKHVPRLRSQGSDAIDMFNRELFEHHEYIRQHFQDMPEIRD